MANTTTKTPVEALRAYLELADRAERRRVARRCDTTVDHLQAIAAGRSQASPKLSKRIHQATHQKVPLHELRPDVWEAPPAPAAAEPAA